MGKILHASGSGYFPGCIESGNDGETMGTLNQLMGMFWRVKKWKATISSAGSGFVTILNGHIQLFSDGNYPRQVLYLKYPIQLSDLITEEENLICLSNGSFFSGIGGEGLTDEQPGGLGINFGFRSAPKFSGSYNLKTYLTGAINYPPGDYDIIIFTEDQEILKNASPGSPFSKSSSYSIKFLGHNLTGFLYNLNSAGPMNVTITATEYWSYGGTYNTSTGQPL